MREAPDTKQPWPPSGDFERVVAGRILRRRIGEHHVEARRGDAGAIQRIERALQAYTHRD